MKIMLKTILICMLFMLLLAGCSKEKRQGKIDKLTELNQNNSIEEMDFENLGPKKILDKLDLDDSQWKEIEKIIVETKVQLKKKFKEAKSAGSEFADVRRDAFREMDKKIEKVLKSKQLEKYRELKNNRKNEMGDKMKAAKNKMKKATD